MSTKCTIRYGKNWHLYEECLEDSVVYLELDNIDFLYDSIYKNASITLKLKTELALEIGLITEKEKPTKVDWDNFGKHLNEKIKK